MTRRTRRAVALALVLTPALAWAMAAAAPAARTNAAPARRGASVPAMRGMPAGVDSGPSPEARRVLESIPDPLAPAERVPPSPAALAAARTADSLRAIAAMRDSARIARLGDSLVARGADSLRLAPADSFLMMAHDSATNDTAAIPVPTAVPMLGDRSPGAVLDTALAATHAPVDTARAAPAAPTAPAECWGVQIGAPLEPKRAESMRDAAQSLLLVPMRIETVGGRRRVRTDRCLGPAAADSLRRRAMMSGFTGAFRIGPGK